jgi:mannitol/fructose-specific phosphotransferase system IIA component (Ntr-type)
MSLLQVRNPFPEFSVKAKYAELDCFIPAIASTDKWQAISELVGALSAAGLVQNQELAMHDLLDRERALSTGLIEGLAIPHTRTGAVSRRCVALGLSKQGLEFDSIDGRPSHVVFLELSPLRGAWPHLEYLADLARSYSNPAWRSELESCASLARARQVLERKL